MPRVSVLMPSLNVVKYIDACVGSVVAQTLQDIEILVIDAGSTDGTLEILEKYAKKDARVKVIHSDKKSYGYQLNMGIQLAQGEYVGVVETDDIIELDMYETLYDIAVRTDAEYVKGTFEKFVEVGKDICWNQTIGTPMSDADMLGKVIEPCTMPELLVEDFYLWSGIYKRDFVSKIKLNETYGAAFQDVGFLLQVLSSANKAVYVDKIVYNYRQDNSGASTFNRKGFHYLVEEYAFTEKFLENLNTEWKNFYYQKMLMQCSMRFCIMAVSGTFWEEAFPDMEILRRKILLAVENGILDPLSMDAKWQEILKLFLQGAHKIYIYWLDEFQRESAQVCKVLKVIGGHQVIIFGCGRYGKFFHALLESKCPETAVAYCDNNSQLWGHKVQGTKVLSPDKAVEQYPEAVYVIANLKSAESIEKQLQEMGIVDRRIHFYHGPINILLFRMPYELIETDNIEK